MKQEMKQEMIAEEYMYARVNYWILTLLCSVFMALFLLSFLQSWNIDYQLSFIILFIMLALLSLHLNAKVKYFKSQLQSVTHDREK